MVEAPKDAILLSETAVGDTWVDTTRVWIRAGVQFALFGVIGIVLLHFVGVEMNRLELFVFLGMVALPIWQLRYQRIKREMNELNVVAISPGHPWHDSEDVGNTTVYVLDQGELWVALEGNVRIVTTSDPLLEQILLRNGDDEGEVLARCNFFPYCFSNVIAIINMAQALANAQDRGEDDVDSFEAAREREESSEGVLEREWQNTEEGAIDYQPGAILRAFKRSNDSEETKE
tara:strand:+ start:5957 stop:6652 length:696 start_codon:yes stop_codon:yes gene_type:complete